MTTEEIGALVMKAKAEGHSVFALTISGIKYIYRSINRAEFRELQAVLTKEAEDLRQEADNRKKGLSKDDPKLAEIDMYVEKQAAIIRERGEERLVEKSLIHPKLTPGTPAGVSPTLADRTMEASGYGGDEQPEML